ncbi:MAG: RimK family protein [Zavarzinella sp.]
MPENLIIVNRLADWPHRIEGARVVPAHQYLTSTEYDSDLNARVFNLCKSYTYQSVGYYVSLQAEARGHRPQPDILTIQDMKGPNVLRLEHLHDLIQQTLRRIPQDSFELSIYFGRTLAERDRQLGRRIFGLFPAPLIRAFFRKSSDGWRLKSVRPIPTEEVPETHHRDLIVSAEQFFKQRRVQGQTMPNLRWSLGLLIDPDEKNRPSNNKAIEKFIKAFRDQDIFAELITSDDFGRIKEFDALFIRTTTSVHHYTFRFARRAAREGLVVIDSPEAIVRCASKVFLAELLERHDIPTPKTMVVHRDNLDQLIPTLGLPCVLKMPDSAFSLGVKKVSTPTEMLAQAKLMLEDSALIVAQEFSPSEFDWRVGVLDGKAIYVCKYHMADGHWQVINHQKDGETDYGIVDTLPVEKAPKAVVKLAVRAAKLIGDGLFGVDIKVVGGKPVIIEVNDNPNIDAGFEDAQLGDFLYDLIATAFARRLENQEHGKRPRRRRGSS